MRALLCLLAALSSTNAWARFGDGHEHSPLVEWFNGLKSARGFCCSFADGLTIKDVDWDTQDGHYRVRLDGQWVDVPDDAVITEPNLFGPAVVWPYRDKNGTVWAIRCFLRGSEG